MKTFINLPEELSDVSVQEAVRRLPAGYKVFDYYVYYDLYHKSTAGFKTLYKAGEIINKSGKNIIRFTKE